MKLQSQATVRFDTATLQRLARESRPKAPHPLYVWIVAGLIVGAGCVPLIRALWYPAHAQKTPTYNPAP